MSKLTAGDAHLILTELRGFHKAMMASFDDLSRHFVGGGGRFDRLDAGLVSIKGEVFDLNRELEWAPESPLHRAKAKPLDSNTCEPGVA